MISNIVFIDSRVADSESLIAGLADGTEWFRLNAEEDGVAQMAAILSAYNGLNSIQIVSHGSPGSITIGSTTLDSASLSEYAATLAQIGSHLTENGDILLLGCNVGAGETGIPFIEALAQVTGADVAASDDATGAGSRNGDWILESSSGAIEASLAFSAEALESFQGILDVFTGTAGADNLVGTASDDTFSGLGGNDSLEGAAGNDAIDGGTGYDRAIYVNAPSGISVDLATGVVSDGYANTDTLISIESIQGSHFNDLLTGNGTQLLTYQITDAPTTFEGMGGNDTIDGGSNAPSSYVTVSYANSPGAVNVNLGTGTASDGFGGTDTLINIDAVTGSAYDDILTGGSNSSQILSINLFEAFEGGLGNDTIDGGAGGDRASYQSAGAAVTVTLGEGAADGSATGGAGTDILRNIEDIRGSAYGDTLNGNSANNTFEGMGGDDAINGGAGYDQARYSRSTAAITATFTGVGTVTVLDGLGGTDTLTGIEEIYGSDFADSLTGNSGNDNFRGQAGNDSIDGGAGYDRASYTTGPVGAGVTVTLSGPAGAGTAIDNYGNTDTLISIESIQGSHFNDVLTGNGTQLLTYQITDAPTTFEGMGGNDTIDGGSNAPSSYVTVSYANSPGAVNVNLGTGTASDGFGGTDTLINIDAVTGSAYDDILTGGSNSSQILSINLFEAFEGGLGNDTIDGGAGGDRASYQSAGAAVTVTLGEGAADGSATGGAGTDILRNIEDIRGSAYGDTLNGNSANNTFEGMGGDDAINGGAGYDQARYSRSTAAITATFTGVGTVTVLDGLGGTDTLTGIEEIYGSDFADSLTGNSGNDNFRGQAGNDSIDGGAGYDRASYTTGPVGAGVTVTLSGPAGAGTAIDNYGNTDTLISIESIQGSHFNDVLTGNGTQLLTYQITDAPTTFEGMGGNDTIDGGSNAPSSYVTVSYANSPGAVNVNLGTGTASDGFGGTDTLINIDAVTGSAYDDILTGGSNSSQILSINLFEAFEGGLGNDTIDGGAGGDRASYQSAGAAVTVTLGEGAADGSATGGAGTDILRNIEDIRGSAYGDTLNGNSANNTFEGMGGDDAINGGAGYDQARYSRSTAAITATFTGVGTVTVLDGLGGTDTLTGIEEIYGSDFADSLTGNSGNDNFRGQAGNDSIDGGAGYDRASYTTGPVGAGVTVTLSGPAGAGTAIDNYGNTDTLISIESIQGSHFNDVLTGNGTQLLTYQITDAPTTFEGMGGNDTIDGGSNAPSSYVTVSYANSPGAVNVNLGTGTASDGFGGTDTLINIDAVTGSAYDDILTGGSNSSQILSINLFEAFEGGLGNDTIDGGAGGDRASYQSAGAAVTVTLGEGAADGSATGGAGTDILRNIEDIRGSAYGDTLNGNSANNTFEGMGGDDAINGGAGYDQARYSRSTAAITATFTGVGTVTVLDGLGGTDTLTGIEEIYGSDFADSLTGNSGNDNFRGQAGNDSIDGGAGYDRASYTTGPVGAGVTVTLSGPAGAGTAIDNYGNTDTLISIESIQGSHFNDLLTGGDGDEALEGMAGNDIITGGNGNDRVTYASSQGGVVVNLVGGVANDSWGGTDTLAGIENITGSNFNDSLTGDTGNNVIFAQSGNDLLVGGLGNDILDGGAGNDDATYAGNRASYTINSLGGSTYTVAGPDGTDTVSNIERLVFNDGDELLPVMDAVVSLFGIAAGTGGFVINGQHAGDGSGRSVAALGDFNGDGLGDVVVGAPWADPAGGGAAGRSYVVLGRSDGSALELSAVATGSGGFVVNGEYARDFSGLSVSGAGDVNGDGLKDLIIAAPGSNATGGDAGRSYVVFGRTGMAPIDLSAVASGNGGFVINGQNAGDLSGLSAAGAGDVNNDGLADIIVGAPGADPVSGSSAGRSYVVFGRTATGAVDLSTLGGGGFIIDGQSAGEHSGWSVAGAGDVNGDGLSDLLVDGFLGTTAAGSHAGRSYVVFGRTDSSTVDLAAVATGSGGFVINGRNAGEGSGRSVAAAGDVNGDGLNDIIVGAPWSDPAAGTDAGRSYVIFGRSDTAAVDLSAVATGSGGFVINGQCASEQSGWSVAGAGDINGDGLADLIIGAPWSDPMAGAQAGRSYVVFGRTDTTAIDLSAVATGSGGFAITGQSSGDQSGISVAGGGDINGDGLADLIVGAHWADPAAGEFAGRSYVIFGSATGVFATTPITHMGTSGNDVLTGSAGSDLMMGGPGADQFVFNQALNPAINLDRIRDFVAAIDQFELASTVFSGLPAGTLASDAFVSGAGRMTAADATDRIIYNLTSGMLYFDADGNAGGSTPVAFAQITSAIKPALSANDFVVFS